MLLTKSFDDQADLTGPYQAAWQSAAALLAPSKFGIGSSTDLLWHAQQPKIRLTFPVAALESMKIM